MMTATWPMGPRGLSLRTGDVTLPASGLRRPPVIDTRVTNDRNSTLVPPSLIPRGTARERARDTLRTGTGAVGTGILSVVYWVPGSPMGRTAAARHLRCPRCRAGQKHTVDHLDVNLLARRADRPDQDGRAGAGDGAAGGGGLSRAGRRRYDKGSRSDGGHRDRAVIADRLEGTRMTESAETEAVYSESSIAVHWREEEYIQPPASFVAQANANAPAIFDRFAEDKFPECFREYADLLTWDQPWDTMLDTSNPPFWKWFTGGKLNASYNCVDRHAESRPDKDAIIWVGEPEDEAMVHITYGELLTRVSEFAAVLRDFAGLKQGDRVTLHMPMVPELPITMLACARLGVIHSQVFGGFSGNACGTRIADSGSRVLITMDGYYRSGALTDHKVKADEAVAEAKKQGQDVDKVLVWRRHPGQYPSETPRGEGRDFFVAEGIVQCR